MLAPPAGFSLELIRVRRDRVIARYRGRRGGAEVTLAHADAATDGCTTVAAVAVRATDPELLAGLAPAVRAHGAELRFVRSSAPPGHPAFRDTERYAVLAGVKPALRRSAPWGRGDALEASLRGAGLAVSRAPAPVDFGHGPSALVYASRDPARARALRDLEVASLAVREAHPRQAARDNRAIGLSLGYPGCCVDAFCERLIARRPDGAPTWVAARAAWTPRPRSRLNNLVAATEPVLVTFEPCSYACGAALAYADAVAAALAAVDEASLARLDDALDDDVAVHRSGAVFHVTLSATEPRVVRAACDRRGGSARAASLVGEAMGPDGRVGDDVLVLDFARSY